ncbi:MAG: Glycine--tRNA ligase beta subunit [Actinobacteria bacterium ADurb.Bin346]|nr:MAG: Glycine--tRNA ligase beta subunit [Actinobacteria bacterium ADurb.Bin346]
MAKNLLIEIGTEELPSSSMYEAVSNFRKIIEENLKNSRLKFSDVKVAVTPRRIVAFVRELSENQENSEKIISGPPKKISFDSACKPTGAAEGFARSLKVNVSDLVEVDTEKGIYLAYKIIEEGKAAGKVLPDLVKDSILALTFAKQMTWGDYSVRFARPIRWIAALFGGKVLDFEIENIKSSEYTYGLRNSGCGPIKIPACSTIEEYYKFLEEKADIILDGEKRKQIILDKISAIEEKKWNKKLKVIIDEGLLAEVINLVETPNVLVGTFPEQYLYLPKDILIKAIQHHQRYFAVIDENGKVTRDFIVVQNGIEDEKGEIVKGNERVLRARLNDAKFFYEEDRKHSFDDWIKKLKGVIFYSGIGTLYDKACRLEMICTMIVNDFLKKNELIGQRTRESAADISIDNLKRAAMICKCDLVTNLVVEFPELQGLVGREYAKEKGEAADVSESVFEHYLPRFANDILPLTVTGAILSIADKFDTISGMFLTGNMPSGSQDPFALRRKAAGIMLTCLDKGFDMDLGIAAEFCIELYTDKFSFNDLNKDELILSIVDFISARYRSRLEKNGRRADIFDAIIITGCRSITELDKRYNALEKYILEGNDITALSEPLTRCKNIIKGKETGPVIPSLLSSDEEISLFGQLTAREDKFNELILQNNYSEALLLLSGFADFVNLFFDKVLVMDENETIRRNRINLVKKCTELYLRVADFSKIA